MSRPRWKLFLAFIAIAVAHDLLYIGLWGNAFAMGERTPGSIPRWLHLAIAILGFPLMLLPEGWFIALRPLLGDDSNALFLVAALNALLWAAVLIWTSRAITARRRVSLPSPAA